MPRLEASIHRSIGSGMGQRRRLPALIATCLRQPLAISCALSRNPLMTSKQLGSIRLGCSSITTTSLLLSKRTCQTPKLYRISRIQPSRHCMQNLILICPLLYSSAAQWTACLMTLRLWRLGTQLLVTVLSLRYTRELHTYA